MATKTHTVKVGRSTGTNLQVFEDVPADVQSGFSDTVPVVLQQYKFARGQLTTASAADTVVTGLATVVAVIASFEADVDAVTIGQVTAQIGDQAGAPAAGSIIIKTWKATSTANPTLVAATAFSKKVNWIAIGT